MVQKSQGQPPFGSIKPVVNKWINYLWCRISAINCKKLWSTTIPMEMVPTKRPRGKVYHVLPANKNGDLPRLFGPFWNAFFYDQRHSTFCWEEFRKCAYYTNPPQNYHGNHKKWCFSRRIWYVYTYIYINIIYKYLPFSKRKQHARFRVPHRYLWEKNTAMLRWSQHAKTHQRFDV